MMRVLTLDEADAVQGRGECSFCGTLLTPGPRGGVSINAGCTGCGAAFNMLGLCYAPDAIPLGFTQLLAEPGRSFTHACGAISYNRADIEQRYCGACHEFVQ